MSKNPQSLAMHVLIIDDDPFISDMYSLKLKEAGFTIDVARDGREGLEKIRAGGYDVVLLDIVLPMKDGFEVLGALKNDEVKHPPIILLTNLGQKEDIDRGLSLGAADYIIKAHFTPSEVVEKIQGLLQIKKATST